jgi:hypothetical protein
LYAEDKDFADAWKAYKAPWSIDRTPYLDFHLQECFLFKNQGFFYSTELIVVEYY